jgi:hypothetical protein
MKKFMLFVLWNVIIACTSSSYAQERKAPPFVSIEEAIEAGSTAVVLPSGPGSALVVTPCVGCKPLLTRATASTTYFLRKHQVTLPELRAALTGKMAAVTVFRSTKDGSLTRVVVDLDAPQPKRIR